MRARPDFRATELRGRITIRGEKWELVWSVFWPDIDEEPDLLAREIDRFFGKLEYQIRAALK